MRITYVCADTGESLSKHNGSAAHVRAVVTAFVELGHHPLVVHTAEADVLAILVRVDADGQAFTFVRPDSMDVERLRDLIRRTGAG